MKIRILVIDDDKTVRESIEKGLTVSGRAAESANLTKKKDALFGKMSEAKESPFLEDEIFDTTLADSGEKGVELVLESIETKNPFQLIFVDIRMPGMSGDECARQINKIDSKVGVCFITGYSDKNASVLVKKVGGALDKILFLKKPFDYDEIRQIARAFNAKWHAERKSEGFQKSLKNIINGILKLKDTPLQDIRKLLQIMLYQILEFIGVDSGFIASIDPSGKLLFEVGAGKLQSPDDIENLQLPTDFAESLNDHKDFVIKRHKDNAIIPMTAMHYQRIIVVVDKERMIEENKNFIKIFTENASVALVNAGLFQELKTAKEFLEIKVQKRTSELEKANKKLTEMAIKDPLTNSYNRRYFDEILNSELEHSKKSNSIIVLMMIDIDYFKSINDRYGHDEGDRILVNLSCLLTENLNKDDVVSRFGGDEFIVIFRDIQVNEAVSIAQRINDLFSNLPNKKNYADMNLGLSIGIASNNSDVYCINSAADLFKKVDEALYIAKKNGRNRIETWEPITELAVNQPDILWDEVDTLMSALNQLSFSSKVDYTGKFESIISVSECKNQYTANHSEKVTTYTMEFLKCLDLEKKYADEIHTASILHDIGKIGIPPNIFLIKEKLTEEEFYIIKSHPMLALKVLKQSFFKGKELLIIKHHHEKFDGSGYPDGLKGAHIPYGSRVITLADSFDAMTSARSYKNRMNLEEAIAEIERCSGTHFDPELAEIFIGLLKKKNDQWPLK